MVQQKIKEEQLAKIRVEVERRELEKSIKEYNHYYKGERKSHSTISSRI